MQMKPSLKKEEKKRKRKGKKEKPKGEMMTVDS